ncbi:hypothetical protein K439DRAFT_1236151, partial [Ramaria rubella]
MDDSPGYIIAMVLNPTVKLTWFCKHWDAAWTSKAEHIILDMLKAYHEKLAVQAVPMVVPSKGTSLETWESLANAYEIDFEDDTAPETSSMTHSVVDKYRAYIEAPLSPKSTDLIKFW